MIPCAVTLKLLEISYSERPGLFNKINKLMFYGKFYQTNDV